MGTAFNAFGITLITKAYLGTSPISSLPFVLSLGLPPSFGTLTFVFNMLFLAGQIIILRKAFPKIQFLQIPVTVIFSMLIDLFMPFFEQFKPSNYFYSVLLLILGCMVMALGITLTILAVIASFTLFGRFRGVREGTIISAFLIGSFVNMYHILFDSLKNRIHTPSKSCSCTEKENCL